MDPSKDALASLTAGPGQWHVRPNIMFARDGRCLLFALHSPALRDCSGCRTIAFCNYYDRDGIRQPERLALAIWEDEGGR